METVLVTGATGAIGTELVRELADRDVRVRSMVRRPEDAERLGAGEVAVADLDDPAAVAAALDGVDAAFLNTPSSEQAAERQIRFADLARVAGVPRLVVLSQYAAREDSPVRFLRWHAQVERHLREIGVAHTVLRPNLFLQGVLAFAEPITRYGVFGAPIGDAAVSAVDVRDIAAVAAVTLTEPGHTGRVYTLTGPRAVTHTEIAAALSEATGRTITFTDTAPDEFAAVVRTVLPEWQVGGLVEDYAHYARGEAADVDPAVEQVTGRPARDLAGFARDVAPLLTPTAA